MTSASDIMVFILRLSVSIFMVCVAGTATAIGMLISFVKNPKRFRSCVDRSSLTFPDPFPGVKYSHITVNGIKLHLVTSETNTGTRPLLLMLHGFPEFWYIWRHQMEAFRDTYDVAAIDMRGYNLSDKPKGVSQYSLPILASDVKEVVRALGRDKCYLMGHDWGGVVAWAVAVLHPEVVEKLLMLASPPLPLFAKNLPCVDQLLKSSYMFTFQLPLLPELLLSNGDYFAIKACLTLPPMAPLRGDAVAPGDVDRHKAALAQPGALTAGINYYRAGARDVLLGQGNPMIMRLFDMDHPVRVPLLVLWAEKDVALGPRLLDGMELLAPQAVVHHINCSHWMPYDAPDMVNSYIREFLAAPTAGG